MQNQSFVGVKYNDQTVWGIKQFSAPMTYQDSLVNEARLVHVIKGNSSLVCAGKTLSLKAGDTLLMKADNFINQWLESGCDRDNGIDKESKNDNEVKFIGFRFTQPLIQAIYQHDLPPTITDNKSPDTTNDESAVIIPPSSLFSHFFQSIEHYTTHQEVLTDSLILLKIRELIELVLSSGTHNQQSKIQQLLNHLFISNQPKLQEVVKTHLFTPLKVEELAFLCHMSESTFHRKFKQTFGTTTNKYFIGKRLEKAEQLVKATDKSLTEIALDCGFEEISYFSRAFKQHFKMSPSQMRK